MRVDSTKMRGRHLIASRRLAALLLLAAVACRGTDKRAAAIADSAASHHRSADVSHLDSLVEAFRAANHVPGASIGIIRGNDTILFRGYGLANVEDSVPATAKTVYRIGSITKQFTAAAILRLEQDGKVRLDAPLSTYLPRFPAPDRRVTIRQLLTHTSGIHNYTELPLFASKRQTDLTDDQLLALVDRRPLDFPPGTSWHYSNSNYYILGVVLQRLTNTPYGAYIERTLAKPLGLSNTQYCGVEPIIPRRASGYSLNDVEVVNSSYLSMRLPGAAGALCSTVGDLLTWQRDLTTGQVVTPATYRAMTTPAVLKDGKHTTYGFALDVSTLDGHPTVEHSGGINGFSADLANYPADSLAVVVLFNTDHALASALQRELAESLLGIPDPGAKDLPVAAADRGRYVGTYAGFGGKPRIEERNGQLVLVQGGPHTLRFQGNDRFVAADDHDLAIQFHVAKGRAQSFTLTTPNGTTFECRRVH